MQTKLKKKITPAQNARIREDKRKYFLLPLEVWVGKDAVAAIKEIEAASQKLSGWTDAKRPRGRPPGKVTPQFGGVE